MTYVFTEGPIDQPWETTEDIDAFWYVHRAGFWKRNRAMPPESTVVEDNFYVEGSKWATELARRLNDLDTARARIALLEARLDALYAGYTPRNPHNAAHVRTVQGRQVVGDFGADVHAVAECTGDRKEGGTVKIEPCPVCGAHAVHHTDVSVYDPSGWVRWVGCVNEDCIKGPIFPTQEQAVTQWNRLSLALSLIEDIAVHLDSPSWNHELVSADDGQFVECQGQDVLRAMLADYREAIK